MEISNRSKGYLYLSLLQMDDVNVPQNQQDTMLLHKEATKDKTDLSKQNDALWEEKFIGGSSATPQLPVVSSNPFHFRNWPVSHFASINETPRFTVEHAIQKLELKKAMLGFK